MIRSAFDRAASSRISAAASPVRTTGRAERPLRFKRSETSETIAEATSSSLFCVCIAPMASAALSSIGAGSGGTISLTTESTSTRVPSGQGREATWSMVKADESKSSIANRRSMRLQM